ncbi:MAG TPA: hypothetical protein VM095_18585 [Pyrinomonadaceae bacterium]|nr:hypothetical protein [Pyrinomonadaceae bacterium]
MSLKFQTQGRSPILFFAPLAFSVLVFVPALYFHTHSSHGNQPFASMTLPPVREVEPTGGSNSPEPADGSFTPEDFARHVAELKKRIPDRVFTIVIQSPFVVVGDGTPKAVKSQAETVRWAVEKLKQDYFTKDPSEILDIWLFKDEASYRKHTRSLFGDDPDTPYGYYSSAHKALIMNIETGGGTLVHEIVHPFVEANFPDCPAWFNEGLGSLYEQSGEQDGHIHGYTNWRLEGLQKAVRARAVPSFKTLTATTTSAFYNQDKGTNYGQARYLCYYLQERGLLVKFYKEFYANRRDDPTGYKTLQSILNEPDMEAFQKKWEKFVLGLSEEFKLLAPA